MTDHPKTKFLENVVLVMIGLLAQAPLAYQLPRWVNGLDPTFVHPKWVALSSFPLVLHMASIPPVFWIAVVVFVFWRVCRNYGWKLEWGL